MLKVNNLAFRYDKALPWLFEDLSFTVKPGEIVGLPGPSGHGKTTLAKIMTGYLKSDRGEVLLDEFPVSGKGFSPVQLLFQHPELSVNPRWKAGRIISEGFEASEELKDIFEIEESWLERYPCELSGGQIARICLVRALGQNTRFLVADEITSMLDAVTQAKIWKALLNYAGQKKMGMVVISHDKTLLNKLCDSMIFYFEERDKKL